MSQITQEYSTKLNLKFGELAPTVSWCRNNCVGIWGYTVLDPAGRESGVYDFHFNNETDYINFMLWQK